MGKILWMKHNLYQQEAQSALEAVREGALLARQVLRNYGQPHEAGLKAVLQEQV
ncbi:MAG: hypothetical protein ACC647_11475 [Anaerolineales bacterium]